MNSADTITTDSNHGNEGEDLPVFERSDEDEESLGEDVYPVCGSTPCEREEFGDELLSNARSVYEHLEGDDVIERVVSHDVTMPNSKMRISLQNVYIPQVWTFRERSLHPHSKVFHK